MTTNLFTHPVFKDGGFTSNDRIGAPLRAAQGAAQHRPRRRARRADLRVLGRARGRGVRRREGRPGRPRPLPRGHRHCSPPTCMEQGYGIRFAIEPKPNEPRGDILLPTVGHALAFIAELEHGDMVGREPRGRARADGRAELRRRHRAGAVGGQALPHRPERPARHQVRPGPRVRPRRPAQRVLPRRPARARRARRRPAYDGPRHFDYKPSRTEDIDRRLGTAPRRTCARTCCCASGPRPTAPTPRCRRRWRPRASRPCASRRSTPARPLADLLADRRRFEDFDADAAGARGYGFVRLNQLAVDHLLGCAAADTDAPFTRLHDQVTSWCHFCS